MKAALVQSDGSLKVAEYPTPEPGPGELVVKVAYCGICGSDVHMLDAGLLPAGSIMGHELSGSIEAVGKDVEGWCEGDQVVVLPLDPCFSCEQCTHGNVQLCQEGIPRSYGLGVNQGGFSQYMRVRPSMIFRVPEGLDLKTAALNEPWSVAVHGVNMSGFAIGGQAVVMGTGPIGLLCVAALKAAGAARIYVSEPDPYRADKARKSGVSLVVDPSSDSPGTVVRETSGHTTKHVFDCAGTGTSLDEAALIAGPRGQIIALGVPMGTASFFPLTWFAKEIALKFSLGYTYQEFADCLQLLAQGAVNPDVIVSDVMPLAEIAQAIKMLHGSGHTKILIDCQAV